MSTASRHLHERLRAATSTGALSTPEQVEAIAYAANNALSKPFKVTAWWCDDCGKFCVDRIMPSPRVIEVVEKAGYVLDTATQVRRGVVLAAAAVDEVDPPPGDAPLLKDTSTRDPQDVAGADLEADAGMFVIDRD